MTDRPRVHRAVLEARVGGETGDIALDDVTLAGGPCPASGALMTDVCTCTCTCLCRCTLIQGFFCFLLRAGARCSREEWRISKDRYAEMSVFPKAQTYDPLCTTMSFFYSHTLTISSSLSDSESMAGQEK